MIKIYYMECDDDELTDFFDHHGTEEGTLTIFRGHGYLNNKNDYFFLKGFADIDHVLTNDLDVLEYGKDDAWNEEEKRFEIFIYAPSEDDVWFANVWNGRFVNIHELNYDGIRRSHNIRKLYIAGVLRPNEAKIG